MQRRIPAAGGIVIVYVALIQAGMVLPTMLAGGLELLTEPVALGMLVATLGLVALGLAVAMERSVRIAGGVWIAGCVVAVVSMLRIDELNGTASVVAVAQLFGGPLALALGARVVPASSTSMRRELGAALLVIGIAGVVGSVWEFASIVHVVGFDNVELRTLSSFAIFPIVMILTSALAIRAARQLLDGRAAAQRALTQWMWVAIGSRSVFTLVQIATLYDARHDIPQPFLIQLLISAALACVMPLLLGRLGRRAIAQPIEARDDHTVPTVLAWAALWFVPTFASAAILVQTSFVAGLLPGLDSARFGIVVSAGCAVAAIALLATAISVHRGAPIARLFVKVTAALSLGALGYIAYLGWTMDGPHEYSRLSLPVGSVAVFATAMIALAWFESRREHDLAPARMVD